MGTPWLVNRSAVTLTKDFVSVRDNVLHKTTAVRNGHSYTARPRR